MTSFNQKLKNCKWLFAIALLTGVVGMVSMTAMADTGTYGNTVAGTDITNTATVNFDVGDTPQPPVDSPEDTFEVDRIVSVFVEAGGGTTVANGEQNAVLSFTVTNDGNDEFDYLLAVEQPATEDFDATSLEIYIDGSNGGTADGIPQPAELYNATTNRIEDLAIDASVTVLVVGDIPAGNGDSDTADVTLKATAVDDSGTEFIEDTDGDDPTAVENVFGDGDGPFVGSGATEDTDMDGEHSDTNTYTVNLASITVAKSSEVLWDPINGDTNPLAIPGALVEYTITVTNAANAANATNLVITDAINANTIFYANGYGTAEGIQLDGTALTNADDADEGDFGETTANTVTVGGLTLTPTPTTAASATVKFQVFIEVDNTTAYETP